MLETVPARSLAATAPADLPALCFHRRSPSGPVVRLYAVGDIGLSGRVAETGEQQGYAELLREVAPLLRTGQIAFGNLEVPFVENASPGALFAASPSGATALAEAGFTLLNVANNHVGDHGPEGLRTTLTAFQTAHLTPLGGGADSVAARALVRTDTTGVRIGWLGCGRTLQQQPADGVAFWEFDEAELLAAIRESRAAVDVLIVSLHIGYMFIDYPHPDHKELAARLADAGADLILMHHAHVLQGVEVTGHGSRGTGHESVADTSPTRDPRHATRDRRGVVCYNLGNFIFDWQEGNVQSHVAVTEQVEGALFAFDLDRQGIAMAAALPIRIDERCRVRWATGASGTQILDRLARISREMGTEGAARFWSQRSERNSGHVLKVLWFHLRHGRWPVVWEMLGKVRGHHLGMLLRWAVAGVRGRGSGAEGFSVEPVRGAPQRE